MSQPFFFSFLCNNSFLQFSLSVQTLLLLFCYIASAVCGYIYRSCTQNTYIYNTLVMGSSTEFKTVECYMPLKARFLWLLWMNNSTTEHDTMKLITSLHSESTVHSNDNNISYYEKYLKLVKMTWHFNQNFAIFAMCSKH